MTCADNVCQSVSIRDILTFLVSPYQVKCINQSIDIKLRHDEEVGRI